jgi:hypothetical protein
MDATCVGNVLDSEAASLHGAALGARLHLVALLVDEEDESREAVYPLLVQG